MLKSENITELTNLRYLYQFYLFVKTFCKNVHDKRLIRIGNPKTIQMALKEGLSVVRKQRTRFIVTPAKTVDKVLVGSG